MSIVDHQTVGHGPWHLVPYLNYSYFTQKSSPFTFESLDLGSEVTKNGF